MSFFTFIYIPPVEHEKVLKEILRVMKPEGELHLWDMAVPEFNESEKIFLLST